MQALLVLARARKGRSAHASLRARDTPDTTRSALIGTDGEGHVDAMVADEELRLRLDKDGKS